MYCRYCKAENSSTTGSCIACGKPLTAPNEQLAGLKRNYGQFRQPVAADTSVHTADGSPIPGDVPTTSYVVPGTVMPMPLAVPVATRQRPPMADTWADAAPDTLPYEPANAPPLAESLLSAGESQGAAPPLIEPILSPEELARRFPAQDDARRWFTSPRSRTALILGVCLLVAIAGAGVWWIGERGGVKAVVAMLMPHPAVAPTGASGTSAEELPYDGTSSAQRTRFPERINLSGHSAASIAPMPPMSPGPPEGGSVSRGGDAIDAADKATISTLGTTDAKDAGPARQVASEKAGGTPRKRTHKPQKPHQRIARGKEIDRIQQQADEELKKKTEYRRAAMKATAQKKSMAVTEYSMVNQLARCEKVGGIFRREQCKWQVCGGKWGKNGCPSYARTNAVN